MLAREHDQTAKPAHRYPPGLLDFYLTTGLRNRVERR